MTTLNGKIALVTGGGRGIGRAIAERLGREGATVAVGYAGDRAAAEASVQGIAAAGGRGFALRAELGERGGAAALWAAFDIALPGAGVDIIVNNAGIACPANISELTEDAFDRVFAVNVRAPFFVVQQGLRRLRDGGRIINISSGAARLSLPDAIAYGPTKSALDNFTRNLAVHLGPRSITVNSVAPGIVDTDMNAGWLRDNPAAQAHAASLAALACIGDPADIAGSVAFLASDDARWITGQVLDVTGGAGL